MQALTIKKENFDELYARYKKTVVGICRRYQPNSMLSEEVFQEIFLKIYTKLPVTFESHEHERAYVIRLSINQCISFFRKKRPELSLIQADEIDTNHPTPETEVQNRQLLEAIDSFIRDQEEELQSVLWLYLYNDYNMKQICEIYKLDYWSTYRRTQKTIKELRGYLKKRNLDHLDDDIDLV